MRLFPSSTDPLASANYDLYTDFLHQSPLEKAPPDASLCSTAAGAGAGAPMAAPIEMATTMSWMTLRKFIFCFKESSESPCITKAKDLVLYDVI